MTKGDIGRNTMKAVLCTGYGPPEVLRLAEVEKPEPKENEILVRISSVVVATEDPLVRKGKPYMVRLMFGLTRPRKSILGGEFAGVVEATGGGVRNFKAGDSVFGSSGFNLGCYAEYAVVPEAELLAIKPPTITSEEAAPVCSALTAWNFLKDKANIQAGQNILINGASGSVGSVAVQIAKAAGAQVTGTCGTANLELVKSLGADRAIDYTREDFTKNGETYDVIFDVAGKSSLMRCRTSLKPEGFYLNPVLGPVILAQSFLTRRTGGRRAVFSATGLLPVSKKMALLEELLELYESGKLKTVIDRRYRLDEIAEAHRYVESGRKRGNVVINMEPVPQS